MKALEAGRLAWFLTLLAAVVTSLTSCATSDSKPVADCPPGLWCLGDFTFEPPRGPGWRLKLSPDQGLPGYSFERGTTPVKFSAGALLGAVGKAHGALELLDERRARWKNAQGVGSRIEDGHGTDCVRSDGTTLTTVRHELVCLDPQAAQLSLLVTYDAPSSASDDASDREAEAFLASVRYAPRSPLPGTGAER